MRLTPSSLLTLTTIFGASLFFPVQTAPVKELSSPTGSEIESPVTAVNYLDETASILQHQHSLQKRCHKARSAKDDKKRKHHHSDKHESFHKKEHSKDKEIRTEKSQHEQLRRLASSSSKKKRTTVRKTTTKAPKRKPTTTTKKTTTKKKSTTTTKKTTTKKTTTKKTTVTTATKKSSSVGSSSASYSQFSGDGTYYTPGLGSCGWTNSDTDLIAALNAPQMANGDNPNNNPNCGKYANVKGPKGTVKVKIVDTCPPCVKGDLDLSPAAFGKIADFADGRVAISWDWA